MRFPWAEAAVLAITFAWGISFVVIPRALGDCGPWTLTALRMAVGAAAGALLLRPRFAAADARTWRHGIAGGLCLTGGYVLQTAGLQTAGSGDAGFLTSFYIVLVPVLDAALHRRRPTARDLAALAIATAGIALIVWPRDGAPLRLGDGDILVLASSLFWAGQIVVVGRIARTADPAVLSVVQVAVVAVVAGAWLPFAGERAVTWSSDFFASVFFLGYVTCALAFAVQAMAQRKVSPTRAAVLFAPEPVFAALAGWFFRDEEFGPGKLAGALLVLVAVALALLPSDRRTDDPEPVGSGA